MSKVYIGVGHGGSDPGAVANGLKEKDLNLSIAKACQSYLSKNGIETKISRTKDVDSGINSKVKEANNWKADLVVEIHINAGGGDGAEVYHSISGGTSKTLAKNILNEIVKIGQQSRGLKTKVGSSGKDYFGIIRDTNAPAVLVECAFIDSKDVNIINTKLKQATMGEAIAKGVMATLGVKSTQDISDGSFKVKVIDDSLNIRKGAGTNYAKTGCITDHGIYTIVQVNGTFGKSGSWGKLKSGAGWISLHENYVKKV